MKVKNMLWSGVCLLFVTTLLIGCYNNKVGMKKAASDNQGKDYLSVSGKIFRSDGPDGERMILRFNNENCIKSNYMGIGVGGPYAQSKDYIFISFASADELDVYKYSFDGEKLILTNSNGENENYINIPNLPSQIPLEDNSEDGQGSAQEDEIERLVGRFELRPDEGDTSNLPFVIEDPLIYTFNEDGTCSCVNKTTNVEKQGIFKQANIHVFMCWNNSLKDVESGMINKGGNIDLCRKIVLSKEIVKTDPRTGEQHLIKTDQAIRTDKGLEYVYVRTLELKRIP